jgi:hypothetical protein
METLINFFVFRPTFTAWGLRILWYAYLLNTVIQTYLGAWNLSQAMAQRNMTFEIWSPTFLLLMLGTLVQLALARLVLEVAAIVIANSGLSQNR